MTTMLERAAMAAKQADLNWNPNDGTWHEHVARAVLMAVREPDEVVRQRASEIYASEPTPVFTAMIDAILNEGAEHDA